MSKGYYPNGTANVDMNFSPDVSMTKSNRGFKQVMNPSIPVYENQSPMNKY